jgi:hypothetical protein
MQAGIATTVMSFDDVLARIDAEGARALQEAHSLAIVVRDIGGENDPKLGNSGCHDSGGRMRAFNAFNATRANSESTGDRALCDRPQC